jgi:DNA-binding NarL/FixJ family response regulator
MTKLRVLLADDHPVVREGLKTLVNAQNDMEVIGEAASGRSAWLTAVKLKPDVVVMDITMPDLGGIEATELIRRDCPSVRVLALTVHEVDGYLGRLLQAGATGYILKRAAADDLVRAIRLVAAGGVCIDPQLAGEAVKSFSAATPPADQPEVKLTDREAQVVMLLARGHINREIAAHLDLSVKTIEVYKARALEKLGLHSRADLVHYALRRGWLQPS